MADPRFYEKQANGTLVLLNLLGEHVGDGVVTALQFSTVGEPAPPQTPLDPVILSTSTMPLRTSATIDWSAPDNTGRPQITGYVVQRRQDGGAWAAIGGSPFGAAVRTASQTGLATATPEIVWEYRVAATNADGQGLWSNIYSLQWQATPAQQPTAPTNLTRSGLQARQVTLDWAVTADSTVTKQGIYAGAGGNTLMVDNIGAAIRSYTWTGLSPSTAYANVNVKRFNSVGWSPASNVLATFTTQSDTAPPPAGAMWMGCSDSPNSHGGTNVWDGWRVYTRGALFNVADRTGTQRPKFMAYSEDGPPLSGSYQSIYDHVLSDLNQFYYGGTGNNQSGRWGIKFYWSNGNENSDKGMLAGSPTAADIAAYVASQKAIYDACHLMAGGSRRFPDAESWTNPTQNHEQGGIVARWLHPAARYLDGVMWSMYPPGRQTTVNDPTYNWPSIQLSDRTNLQLGFLARCFYRTKQAEIQARTDRGQPGYVMQIGCGEVGTGRDPNDGTTRPYYAVHALAAGMQKLSTQESLPMPFTCWWDNAKDAASPQNILDDEPNGLNPTTREAWQNWRTYNHQFNGTHPASWSNNPKAAWQTTGTVI